MHLLKQSFPVKRIAFVLWLTIVVLPVVHAQTIIKALPRWMVSMHADLMFPQDPIRRFSDADEWGIHAEAQYRLMYNKPFMAGLFFSEAGLSRYVIKYTEVTQDGEIDIREKANTRRLQWGLTAGFYPEVNWLLQPYLQGRIGMALFHSSSVLIDRDDDEVIERFSEADDLGLTYGLDLGIHIVPNIWYIRGDVRIGFVANPSASYLLLNPEKKGTVFYPINAFDEHVSSGRWFKISAGMSYLF